LAGYPLTDRRQFDILLCGPRSSWKIVCNSITTGASSSRFSAAGRRGGGVAARGVRAAADEDRSDWDSRFGLGRCCRLGKGAKANVEQNVRTDPENDPQ
jgi:hypothetical protein